MLANHGRKRLALCPEKDYIPSTRHGGWNGQRWSTLIREMHGDRLAGVLVDLRLPHVRRRRTISANTTASADVTVYIVNALR